MITVTVYRFLFIGEWKHRLLIWKTPIPLPINQKKCQLSLSRLFSEQAWSQFRSFQISKQKRISKSEKGDWGRIVHSKSKLSIILLPSGRSVGATKVDEIAHWSVLKNVSDVFDEYIFFVFPKSDLRQENFANRNCGARRRLWDRRMIPCPLYPSVR